MVRFEGQIGPSFEAHMTLVKTSKISDSAVKARRSSETARSKGLTQPRATRSRAPRKALGKDKVSERVAAATEELASGLAQASAAAEELRRSMEQIATGADEAAGASQEQLTAIKQVTANLITARGEADNSRRRTESAQVLLAETAAQIGVSIQSIERSSERQVASGAIISELERRAKDVSEITGAVSRISDQTNLLALNAAIEAARAGDHGRGFAVVADEVRALADVSDQSAIQVQGLAEEIQTNVREAAVAVKAAAGLAVEQVNAGRAVVETLAGLRQSMIELATGSQETFTAAIEAERAIQEAQRGAELVAGAAEEQASAASEAQSAVRQQAQSLGQGQAAAQSLASLSEGLRAGTDGDSAAEQIASTAEELSATIQELSSAASQIATAVEQINRGSQQQAAAAQQTSAALAQIEKAARLAQEKGRSATDLVSTTANSVAGARKTIESLIGGVGEALETTRASLETIVSLESLGRRIEKIVDAISLVNIQTNMLAVSGAVEAARAGETGRGFALVSNDIRSLAREASASVERVKDTVRGILDQITLLRRDLEQIISAGELEVQNNRTVMKALEDITGEFVALGNANRTIQQGAQAILVAAGETATAARQIAAAAEEASAASRQAATASIEQAQGADDLAAAIEEIASLSDELKKQNG
jgi:methyl-accepting chemotaxis protein